MSREHWAVTVYRNGEQVVTIESNSLAGRELSPEDEDCIRNCACHLLAFVGRAVGKDEMVKSWTAPKYRYW